MDFILLLCRCLPCRAMPCHVVPCLRVRDRPVLCCPLIFVFESFFPIPISERFRRRVRQLRSFPLLCCVVSCCAESVLDESGTLFAVSPQTRNRKVCRLRGSDGSIVFPLASTPSHDTVSNMYSLTTVSNIPFFFYHLFVLTVLAWGRCCVHVHFF